MADIDFGKAFNKPGAGQDPTLPESPALAPGGKRYEPVEPARFRRSRLGRSHWANIIFVIIAVLGGLFCAFYFFNGAELVRVAARWPREFLYPRPSDSVMGNFSSIGNDFANAPASPAAPVANAPATSPSYRAGNLSAVNPLPAAPGLASNVNPGTTGAPGVLPNPIPDGLNLPSTGVPAADGAIPAATSTLSRATAAAHTVVVQTTRRLARTTRAASNAAKRTTVAANNRNAAQNSDTLNAAAQPSNATNSSTNAVQNTLSNTRPMNPSSNGAGRLGGGGLLRGAGSGLVGGRH
jgi:hypothetical protein